MEKIALNDRLQLPKMDDFMKETRKGKTRSNELQIQAIIEKIQNKTREDFYGPLDDTWKYVEGLNALEMKQQMSI